MDPLLFPLDGQLKDLVRLHAQGRRVQLLDDQLGAEWGRDGRVEVDVGDEEVARLEIPDELVRLDEAQARVDGAVDDLHGQGLVGRQGFQVREVRLHEDDGVIGMVSPELHKVDDVPEPEGRVTAKHDAGLPVLVGEAFGMEAGKVLEPAVLGQVGVRERLLRQVHFALLPLRQPTRNVMVKFFPLSVKLSP